MRTNITNVRLQFNCTANWEEMRQLDGCRFREQCHKKVYDFTGSTREEFEQVLAANNNKLCGRFTTEQATVPALVTPFWKKWVSAAIVLLGFNFISCKDGLHETSAREVVVPTTQCKKTSTITMGNPLRVRSNNLQQKADDADSLVLDPPYNDDDFTQPSFPGGETAMTKYFKNNIPYLKGTPDGRVIASFTVTDKGRVTDIKILRGLTQPAEQTVIRALENSPKWNPGTHHNKPISTKYTIPVSFKG